MEKVQNGELVKKAYEYYVNNDRGRIKEKSDEFVENIQRAVNNWLQFNDKTLFSDKNDNLLYSNGKHWASIGRWEYGETKFQFVLRKRADTRITSPTCKR